MSSGKSEGLIRRVGRALIARQRVQVFKASLDTRYSAVDVVSHSGQSTAARPVRDVDALWAEIRPDTHVVMVAGLDLDFRGEPFGLMPELIARADAISKLTAVCALCGEPNATRTQRLVGGLPAEYAAPLIAVGAADLYEARCRAHHEVPGKPRPLAPWAHMLGSPRR